MIKELFIYVSLLAVALCSCSENDGPDAPGTLPPPVVDENTGINVSVVSKFKRFSQGEMFDGTASAVWSDTVWQNDRAYGHIALWTLRDDVSGISFEAEALKNYENEIPVENICLRSVAKVAGDPMPSVDAQPLPRPEAVYVGDALVEDLPSKLTTHELSDIWVTINVPESCPAGLYTGKIYVKQNDAIAATVAVRILVADHCLPKPSDWKFYLDLWQFPFQISALLENEGISLAPFSDDHFRILESFYGILADAGQKSITTYIKDGAFNVGQTMVDWSRAADGSWQFDYSKFDNFVEFMMNLGITKQINCMSLAGWNNFVGYSDLSDGKYKYLNLTIGSEEYEKIWSEFLSSFRSHLMAKGWFDIAVLYFDEIIDEDMAKIVKLIRKNGADWKIGVSGKYYSVAVERELFNYSVILGNVPTSTSMTIPMFYTSCSQMHPNNYITPENSPAEMTWMAWHALASGYKGYQRWAFDYWQKQDPFDARDRANTAGDFSMIYRSGNTTQARAVSSIRFELLRDGIQDYEKARILGLNKFSSVLSMFKDTQAVDAQSKVMAAQALIKQVSVQ